MDRAQWLEVARRMVKEIHGPAECARFGASGKDSAKSGQSPAVLFATAVLLLAMGGCGAGSIGVPVEGTGSGQKEKGSALGQSGTAAGEFRLRLRLPEGMTWPADALPQVYSQDQSDKVRSSWQPVRRTGETEWKSKGVRSVGGSEFEVRLQSHKEPFYVAVHVPQFLRFFERGPFKLSDIKDGVLEVAVEKPITLDIHFDIGDVKIASLPFDQPRVSALGHWAAPR